MRQYHPSACSSTYLNIMYVMVYINGAAQACPIYINHNGIMLNRSFEFLSAGLSLKRTAATPRGPPGSSSSVRWVSAVPLVLARPHPPALSVPCHAPPCFRYRPFFGGRRAPPLFVLSFGLSRPLERLPAVPSVLALPPRPARSVLWRALFRFRNRLFLPYRPHPPDQCFRSVSFRRPLAVEDFERRAKQVRTPLEIV